MNSNNDYQCVVRVVLSMLLITVATTWLASCATTEQLAPSVYDAMLVSAERLGYGDDQVERGRVIYLSKCIKCHGVRNVKKYSAAAWEGILVKMSVKAKLSEVEEEDVGAYIYSVIEIMEGPQSEPASNNGGF